ncbi:fructosamine kinase family protein [Algihabitans albus]|uniref:fructosamine kinase family protein n=1 Tax=Algihabitans albus TaxID=2164067 RepID=UPI000E5D60E9|nr:fructosamine kinase family protein [Algihabitans albus]
MTLAEAVEAALGVRPSSLRSLGGGCIAEVVALDLPDGQRLVAKRGASGQPGLELEAWMLAKLRDHRLPVPEVIHAGNDLLIMTRLDDGGRLDAAAETRAAEAMAALHANSAEAFGLERETVIGSLPQPNPWNERWLPFFAEQRLRAMARLAHERGRLPAEDRTSVEDLAGRLDRYLDEPQQPALLHGDLWSGNVLVGRDGAVGFIDPAVYYGHPEVELAFTTLFGTFGEAFFRRYAELAPLEPDFFEARRDLYNLYPLLVHVALFGGGYLQGVRRVLRRFL